MGEFLSENTTIILILSVFAATVFFYFIDYFRKYVLDGSRDPVRVTSLRYLQIFVALFTLAALGVALTVSTLMAEVISDRATSQALTQNAPALPDAEELETQFAEEAPTAIPTNTPSPTPEPTPARTAEIANTGGAGANMRSLPGMTGTIITSINDGTTVILLNETEAVDGFSWRKIALLDGREGWVVEIYLVPNP
jgi:hypothetical protein